MVSLLELFTAQKSEERYATFASSGIMFPWAAVTEPEQIAWLHESQQFFEEMREAVFVKDSASQQEARLQTVCLRGTEEMKVDKQLVDSYCGLLQLKSWTCVAHKKIRWSIELWDSHRDFKGSKGSHKNAIMFEGAVFLLNLPICSLLLSQPLINYLRQGLATEVLISDSKTVMICFASFDNLYKTWWGKHW